MSYLDLNSTPYSKREGKEVKYFFFDLKNKTVGREIAGKVANCLRDKLDAYFTPHSQSKNIVVILNSDKIVFTGDKLKQKLYRKHTGKIGHLKEWTAKEAMEKNSTQIIYSAIYGMLPKNTQRRRLMKQVRIFKTHEHNINIENLQEV